MISSPFQSSSSRPDESTFFSHHLGGKESAHIEAEFYRRGDLVDVLPPGPEERTNSSQISRSSIEMFGVMYSMSIAHSNQA
jgi:hypothetical protein